MKTLVLGGIRSGKSAYAEQLLADCTSPDNARVIATGPRPDAGDSDWQRRIAAHRTRRPQPWSTVESADLATLLGDHSPTLVDDLGSWLTAHLDRTDGWDSDDGVEQPLSELCSAVSEFDSDLILVSSEVGLSLVAPTPVGRRYQDLLGEVNAAVGAVVDRVVLIVAGVPLVLDGAAPAPAATPAAVPIPAPAPSGNEPATATETAPADPYTVDDDPVSFPPINPPDRDVSAAATERQTQLTKPVGALGRLEEVAVWAAACQGVNPPTVFAQPTVVVFAGDHGVARSGVSAYPPEVTAQMVQNFVDGGAAVNVLARQHGASVRVVDMSVDADTPEQVRRHKIRRSSGDLRVEDALTADETRRALAAGRAIADAEIDSGADLLIAGEMGIGNTTPATVLIALMTGAEPVAAVGRGTGIDDHAWCRKTAAVRDGMRRARVHARMPIEMLQRVAGADLTAMVGFLAQAAARKTPVLLDGVVVTAAALVADDMAPGARQWWLAAHRSTEPAHTMALEHLDLVPLLDLSMRLGEGSGALTALPIVQSAVATLATMATFEQAGVSGADTAD